MNIKQLRGQVRQIVKEMFVELTQTELYQALTRQNREQLQQINDVMTKRMDAIEQRHNDVVNMIMRELANKTPVMPALDESKGA